jgi:hypothetical protein
MELKLVGGVSCATREDDHSMRKFGIVLTVLLLAAVLALMLASAGILPFSLSRSTSSTSSASMPFRSSLEEATDHVAGVRPKLQAITPHGEIQVQGADVEQVQVHMKVETRAATPLRAQELLKQVTLEITTTDEENQVKVLQPRIGSNESVRADLSILVPHQTELDLQTGLGQVEVTGIEGSLAVLDQLGAIKVRNFKGDAHLETSLGNIEISQSVLEQELVAISHLGDLIIEASLARRNVLESSLGDLTLLLLPAESYVLEGRISLGKFTILVPFKGEQSRERIQGIVGEGEQRGSIFVDLSLGSLELKNPTNGRD